MKQKHLGKSYKKEAKLQPLLHFFLSLLFEIFVSEKVGNQDFHVN